MMTSIAAAVAATAIATTATGATAATVNAAAAAAATANAAAPAHNQSDIHNKAVVAPAEAKPAAETTLIHE